MKAIPLIMEINSRFEISQQALAFFQSIQNQKIGVVSIVGKYRTGKSLLINRVLLHQKNAFKVGPSINPCTKVIYLIRDYGYGPKQLNAKIQSFRTQKLQQLTLKDLEVQMKTQTTTQKYFYLPCFCHLGNIDENALNTLNLIINMAKNIHIAGQSKQISDFFPSFLWIVRDFSLQIVDKEGFVINAKQYLENALEIQKGVSDSIENKNKIRRMVKSFFKDRDCITLVRPVQSEQQLQKLEQLENEQFRTQFIEQANQCRNKIFKKVKPKIIKGKLLTGSMLLQLTKFYASVINQGGIPNIQSAWINVIKYQTKKACNQALQIVENNISRVQVKKSKSQLKFLKEKWIKQMFESFKAKTIANKQENKEFQKQMIRKFKIQFGKLKDSNKQKWERYYHDQINKVIMQIQFQEQMQLSEYILKIQQSKQYLDNKLQTSPEMDIIRNQLCNKKFIQLAINKVNLLKLQQQSKINLFEKQIEVINKEKKEMTKDFEIERNYMQEKMMETQKQKTQILSMCHHQKYQLDDYKKKIKQLENRILLQKKQVKKVLLQWQEKFTFYKSEQQNNLNQLKNKLISTQNNMDKQIALKDQKLEYFQKQINEKDLKNLSLQSQLYKIKDQLSKLQNENENSERINQQSQKEISEFKREENIMKEKLISEKEKIQKLVLHKNELNKQIISLECQLKSSKKALQESKKIQQELLKLIHNNSNNFKQHQLYQTNKNLSNALDRAEQRCKMFEEKFDKFKQYKKMIKHSICIQCSNCTKIISTQLFSNHIFSCTSDKKKQKSLEQKDSYKQNFSITIDQSTRISKTDKQFYNDYMIFVNYQGRQWNIHRKYKNFCELHRLISRDYYGKISDAQHVVCPNNVNNAKLTVMIKRKLLQKYLKDLFQHQRIRESKHFKQFIGLSFNSKQKDQELKFKNSSNHQPNLSLKCVDMDLSDKEIQLEKKFLPQSPESFLKAWHYKNEKAKETKKADFFNDNLILSNKKYSGIMQNDISEKQNGYREQMRYKPFLVLNQIKGQRKEVQKKDDLQLFLISFIKIIIVLRFAQFNIVLFSQSQLTIIQ